MPILYTFRVRDGRTGKWRTIPYKMTLKEAADRYGDGICEPIEESKEEQPLWRYWLRQIFEFFS